MQTFVESINPATGESFARYPLTTRDESHAELDRAGTVYRRWRRTEMVDRARLLTQVVVVLEENGSAGRG